MSETLDYLKMFARFPASLRHFLQSTLTLEDARQIARQRMEQREENFLQTVERNIYGYSQSPYLALLKLARCELSDLQTLVKQKGLEGALYVLREAGVFITFEEFKGRKPIVRYGQTVNATARSFDNPFTRRDFIYQTGGSTGLANSVAIDFDQIVTRTPQYLLTLAAHNLHNVPTIFWRGILPDSTFGALFRGAHIRHLPQRWFSHIGWHASKYWLKYDVATYYILLWARLCGVQMPLPEYANVDQAEIVARCVAETLKTHGQCLLHAQVSRALRVCLAAEEAGLDLRGAVIKGGGEPVTTAKIQAMARAGIRHIPNYSTSENGILASGCAQPADGSDVHLFKDACALITYPYQVEGLGATVPAFNLTTILPTTSKLMFNVQMDDYGIVEERHCGCELETYGYTTHLREIRSYSKLTGEGVTLIGNEMMRILEEVLPARFGGSPLDYQLMEHEDEQGLTRLALIIHPRIEVANEQEVIAVVLDGLRQSSAMADAARSVWQNANTIQIMRMEPIWTTRGKLLPLHIQRRLKNS